MAANGGVAPEPSFGAGDAFLVQCAGNRARADACGKLAEDAPHDIGLGFVDLAVAPDRIAACIELLHHLVAQHHRSFGLVLEMLQQEYVC